jgi:hypothetical protein
MHEDGSPHGRHTRRARARGAIAGLAAAALVAVAGPAHGEDATPIEPAAFVATLDRLASDVRAVTHADAPSLAGQLPAEWTIQAGGDRFTVTSAPIADALREAAATHDDPASWRAARDRVAASIEAMRAEAERLTVDGPAPPAHVRAALGEVLAAPEFRGREQYAALMGLADRMRKWVEGWFRPLEGSGHAIGTFMKWLSWIAAAAAFLVLAALVWRLLRSASRDTSAVTARLKPAADPADARTWAGRARAAAAAGDAREAVRSAYHAVLHRLDEDGAWTIEEARTPREYLRLLPAADRRHPAVASVARLFEGTWYGGVQPGLDEAQAAVGRLGELGCDTHADPAI